MVTAVDTSAALDVRLNATAHCSWSIAALRHARAGGSLILSHITSAAIALSLSAAHLPQFLTDWNLTFVPSSQSSGILAGEMFRIHLQRGGKRSRVVPDFLVAAHAQTHAQRL